jgi:hypothetical protein
MPCGKTTFLIKPLLIVVIGTVFLVYHQPAVGADKIRVAFSAVAPTQGVLWVADVGGLFKKNDLSAEIIYTGRRSRHWSLARLTSPR